MVNSPKQKRIRFSLRWLFVALLFVCVLLGWISQQFRWKRQREAILHWVTPLQQRQLALSRGEEPPPNKGYYIQRGDVQAPWSLAIFGEAGITRIEIQQHWFAADPPCDATDLQELFPEAEIVWDTRPTQSVDTHSATGEYPIYPSAESR